jgi:hypothetical protein
MRASAMILKPALLNLAEWSVIAPGSASHAFTELLSAFNRKLGEISSDRVRIHSVDPDDRPRVHRVRRAGLRPLPQECRRQ